MCCSLPNSRDKEICRSDPFCRAIGLSVGEISVSKGNAYAIKSDQLSFGWVVNAETDVAGKKVEIGGMPDGKYLLQLYHTWRGQFLDTTEVASVKGKLSFTIPVHSRDHANYIGQDVAFILKPEAIGSQPGRP